MLLPEHPYWSTIVKHFHLTDNLRLPSSLRLTNKAKREHMTLDTSSDEDFINQLQLNDGYASTINTQRVHIYNIKRI